MEKKFKPEQEAEFKLEKEGLDRITEPKTIQYFKGIKEGVEESFIDTRKIEGITDKKILEIMYIADQTIKEIKLERQQLETVEQKLEKDPHNELLINRKIKLQESLKNKYNKLMKIKAPLNN